MDTTSRKPEHIEVFKCRHYTKKRDIPKQNPFVYCFSFIDNKGDICFSSFEDRKLNRRYLDRLCQRADVMFGETPLESVPLYTNVPMIHHSPDTEILNEKELETIRDYLSQR